jgi:hypothetical protein
MLLLAMVMAVCVAFESDNDGRVAALDDLALVEVDDGADCAGEILQAKTKCAEKVAYYKKIHDTQCGDTELKGVMARIKRNQEKAKKLGKELVKAKEQLRQGVFEEQRFKTTAAAAKEKLMKALVQDEHQKMAMKAAKTSVADELKDQNSLRAKANKATTEAVALAEKEPTMAKVTPKAAEAKQLFAKMVEEKIHLARARYAKKNSQKTEKGTEKLIQKLFEEAKKAREKELEEMKKVKGASVKVAEKGSKISQEETKVAREERDGSKKQQEKAQKAEAKLKGKADKGQTKVQKAQALVEKLQKELAAAQKEEKKTENLDLKSLLAQASGLIKKPTREERDEDGYEY